MIPCWAESDGSPRISNEEKQIKERQRPDVTYFFRCLAFYSANIKVMFDRGSVRCRVCGIVKIVTTNGRCVWSFVLDESSKCVFYVQ